MHEMGIANSLIEAVRGEAARRPGTCVTKVGLRLGEWAGVDVESLRFCVEALAKGTELDGMNLDIEFRPRGSEMDITYLELEE